MRLSLIFDSKIDPPNASIKEVMGSLLRAQKGSKALEKALERSLGIDPEEVELFENDSFVLLRQEGRERIFTKE